MIVAVIWTLVEIVLLVIENFVDINWIINWIISCVYKMPRNCKNQADSFCHICGELTLKRCRRRLTPHVKKLYELYFGRKLGDQDKNWAPHICCVKCASSLSAWANRSGRGLTFGV